jgi:hypothetical protein
MHAVARHSDRRRGRPPARDVAAVFGLGVAGSLIPIAGWVVGVWLVLRASSWSAREKLLGLVGPIVVLLVAVGVLAAALGADVRLPVLAAVPLTLSIASAIGALYLALRLVAHTRAAAVTDP